MPQRSVPLPAAREAGQCAPSLPGTAPGAPSLQPMRVMEKKIKQARFVLQVRGDAAAALKLAESNWQVQREPADVRVYVQAAAAAGDRQAARHILEWIEQNFPGEELPAIEAEYSIDRLRHLEDSSAENPGLEALYQRVCSHFNVASLVMVPEAQWTEYVTTLRAQNGFSLHPHSLYADDGKRVVGLTVSFILAEDRA